MGSLRRALIAMIPLLVLAGCGGPEPAQEDDTTKDLRQISSAYEVIMSGKNRPPKSMDEIRQVLSELHAAGMGDAPDEVLVSSRDGQPYVVKLGVELGSGAGGVFAHEQTGVDGKRYVMTMSRDVSLMSNEEFSQLNKPGS